MQVATGFKLLLCRGRAADQDTLEPLEEILLSKKYLTCEIANLLVELVDGNQPQPLEPDA